MVYDKEDIYDEQISPLMAQIIGICKEHKIPMCATFQYSDGGHDGPEYCTTSLPFDGVASEHMKRVARTMLRPADLVCLTETHITNPDGSKTIHIARV